MTVAVISFTGDGIRLSCEISKRIEAEGADFPIQRVELFTKCSEVESAYENVRYVSSSLCQWSQEHFDKHHILLFIGACQIAVRAIAPVIKDKLKDSPVLVMDEKAQYIIPILSGHVGGANELALLLAQMLKCIPVITTATDVHGKFAVDVFARKNHLHILNREGIVKVSSKVLRGETIYIYVEPELEKVGTLPKGVEYIDDISMRLPDVWIGMHPDWMKGQELLCLIPKQYVIGIGCKKGKQFEELSHMLEQTLTKAGIRVEDIVAFTSIDLKKEELGILQLSEYYGIPFVTFSSEELDAIPGEFSASEFVRQTIGVDNVCERSAIAYCEDSGELILSKQMQDGITMAVARKKCQIVADVF